MGQKIWVEKWRGKVYYLSMIIVEVIHTCANEILTCKVNIDNVTS